MNTIIIFDQCEANILFFNVDSDVTRLDGAYINSTCTNDSLADDLHDLLYDRKGKMRLEKLTQFPADKYVPGQTKVIVCGFLP